MRRERPFWVRFGMWGVPNRPTAWVLLWVCMAAAMGFVAYGFVDPHFAFGALFILGSIGYYAVIRWMDRHDGWS